MTENEDRTPCGRELLGLGLRLAELLDNARQVQRDGRPAVELSYGELAALSLEIRTFAIGLMAAELEVWAEEHADEAVLALLRGAKK